MLKIELDDKPLKLSLEAITKELKHPKTLYGILGETLKKTHAQRFKDQKTPTGEKWTPLATATLKRKQARGFSSLILKQRGYLSDKLAYNTTDHSLEFGSSEKYARIHHKGGDAGRGKKVKIPARPWLGVSEKDKDLLLQKARTHLTNQLLKKA